MSENSLANQEEEKALDASAQRALQEALLSPRRSRNGDRMNERLLAHIATGCELEDWGTLLRRRLQWMAVPFVLGFALCYFGATWQWNRRTAAIEERVATIRAGYPVKAAAPPAITSPLSFQAGDRAGSAMLGGASITPTEPSAKGEKGGVKR